MQRPVLFLVLLLMPPGQVFAADQPPPDMVLIPAGEFRMGSDTAGAEEAPAHRVYVSAFYIDRHEVTNAAFAQFVRSSASFDTVEGPWFRYCAEGCIDLIAHYQRRYGTTLRDFNAPGSKDKEQPQRRLRDAARWRAAVAALREMLGEDRTLPEKDRIAGIALRGPVQKLVKKQARLPVRGVTWRDAGAFARWAGKRLPTEAEWEKAARGTDGRRYPWGPSWGPRRCRTGLAPEAGPAPVGSYPRGASPYGCRDMAGNVWEWVADWYGPAYYGSSQGAAVDPKGPKGLPDGQLPAPSEDVDLLRSARQGREPDTRKVLRGGGWSGPEVQAQFNVRCAKRFWSNPSYWHQDVGFRCAKDGPQL